MAEHLDHLLALHHFLDVAVQGAQVFLLRHEIFPALGRYPLGHLEHDENHDNGQHRQRNVQHEHADEHTDNGNGAGKQLRDTLADHLPQGVDIVGVNGHDIAVGMGVKVPDGQAFHMGKQIVTQPFQRALADIDQYPVVKKRRADTDGIKTGYPGDGVEQTGEIRAGGADHGQNIHIDQCLHKHGSLYVGQHADKDADHRNNTVGRIVFQNIGHQSSDELAGIFHLGPFSHGRSPAGAALECSCFFFCHYASPPFSSKSPLPPVWDSYTSR